VGSPQGAEYQIAISLNILCKMFTASENDRLARNPSCWLLVAE
jgi:hypothetical protein